MNLFDKYQILATGNTPPEWRETGGATGPPIKP